ncbi:necrosis inducing protein-domain-containing protein, partial [Colletotrichum cereale]
MLGRTISTLGFFALLGAASAGEIRDNPGGHNWIDHDQVRAFQPSSTGDLPTQLALRFNPFLYVEGGCDVYPAVDDGGNLSGGLKPTPKDGRKDGCDKGGKGQVYARLGRSQNRTGIMYSYYTPKVRWGEGDDEGHRHYWTYAVVWLLEFGCSLNEFWPTGLAFTRDHQSLAWSYTTPLSYAVGNTQMPTHPRIQLQDRAIEPFTGAEGDQLFERPLITWEALPPQAKAALNDVRYEHTTVPFSEDNFQGLIDAAYWAQFYSDAP